MKRDGVCANHPDKPIHSRGLCAKCYRLALKGDQPTLARVRVHTGPRTPPPPRDLLPPSVRPSPPACPSCGGRVWKEEGPLWVCCVCSRAVRVRF
jgi:hypothetical protein